MPEDEDEEGTHSPTGMTETPSSSETGESEDEFNLDSVEEEADDLEEEADEEVDSDVDSDFLDEEDVVPKRKKGAKAVKPTTYGVKGKGKSKVQVDGFEDEDDGEEMDIELEDGQEIAGRIYPAPKTGQGR